MFHLKLHQESGLLGFLRMPDNARQDMEYIVVINPDSTVLCTNELGFFFPLTPIPYNLLSKETDFQPVIDPGVANKTAPEPVILDGSELMNFQEGNDLMLFVTTKITQDMVPYTAYGNSDYILRNMRRFRTLTKPGSFMFNEKVKHLYYGFERPLDSGCELLGDD